MGETDVIKQTGGQVGGRLVSWMVRQLVGRAVGRLGGHWSGELGDRAECWTVGRSDSCKAGDTGAATFGQSDGREFREQVNLAQRETKKWGRGSSGKLPRLLVLPQSG